jgi:hypothetical protein
MTPGRTSTQRTGAERTGAEPMTPVEALQKTLAAEHAAVYVYGVVGGRVSVSAQPRLWSAVRSAYNLHRARRDQLTSMVRTAGAEPVPAEVSYQMPNMAGTPAEQEAASRTVEERCCAVYADLVGSTSRAQRQWALDALEDAAVRLLGFGGAATPYPGIEEL